MKVLIIGANGSMGKRYQAIFNYLGVSAILSDKEHGVQAIKSFAGKTDGVVIASPTSTHVEMIRALIPIRKPILCEKPVTKNLTELTEVLKELEGAMVPFRMMYQYSVMTEPNRIGRSYYNFYNHGTDGLIWDCMQIIGLSRGQLELGESSPIWRCMINGQAIKREHMDAAYVAYVQKWIKYPNQSHHEILKIHEKTKLAEKQGIYG